MAIGRILVFLSILAIATSSCAASDGDGIASRAAGGTGTTTSSTVGGVGPAVATPPSGPSALEDPFDASFPEPLIDPAEITSGGPPPDGIPPVDDPVFLPVAENLGILPANEPVVALELNGDARAYPVRALVWHEIVNDTVGGVPVSITYCPLCNSAATYERTIDGAVTTFGTSGKLYASALVMYDRATESLWTHYNGEAVVGVLTGKRLVEHPSPLLAWGDFRTEYPTGQILDWTETGFDRRYGSNPYTAYDDPDNTPFLFRGALDDRAAAMQRVVGIEIDGDAIAIPLDTVDGDGTGPAVTPVTVGGTELIVFWKPGQASALDRATIADGFDVGSVAVFEASIDDQVATFFPSAEGWVDDLAASTWTIAGRATDGGLEGRQLARVPHLDTFWFAWSTYQPETRLIDG